MLMNLTVQVIMCDCSTLLSSHSFSQNPDAYKAASPLERNTIIINCVLTP